MATINYRVALEKEEVRQLEEIVRKGVSPARTITRARVLLLADAKGPRKSNREIREVLNLAHSTPTDIRRRYSEGGLARAIHDAPRTGQPKKILPKHEAFVIATACTEAPEGHDHWTLGALRGKLLRTYRSLKSISDERVRHILLRAALKPWREKNVVRPLAQSAVS